MYRPCVRQIRPAADAEADDEELRGHGGLREKTKAGKISVETRVDEGIVCVETDDLLRKEARGRQICCCMSYRTPCIPFTRLSSGEG